MAYNSKNVFYLDTSIATTTGAGDGVATLDLSSYVQPIARGRTKGQGLAIYKVWWDISPVGANSGPAAGAAGQLRAGLISFTGVPAAAVGGVTLSANQLQASNDLMISGMDYVGGATAAGDPWPNVWLEPTKEVPYIVVRDQISLWLDVSTALTTSSNVNVRMECATVSLDSNTLNQLLRTQTV